MLKIVRAPRQRTERCDQGTCGEQAPLELQYSTGWRKREIAATQAEGQPELCAENRLQLDLVG